MCFKCMYKNKSISNPKKKRIVCTGLIEISATIPGNQVFYSSPLTPASLLVRS